ncbi:FMN-dependent alpha-hydroxy acid dehydrogenase [Atractiella rhizophila]|nr:FMN-dependent alpha-hydroxy acid dehydrogenase [Atractiella rhizophila]
MAETKSSLTSTDILRSLRTPRQPEGIKYSAYLEEIYRLGQAPEPLGSVDWRKWEEKAREKFAQNINAFLYTFGSAGTCSTEAANRRAFENYHLQPRMLVNTTHRNVSTDIFGVNRPTPLIIAPIGVQGLLHSDAECATARAASKMKIPFTLSTAATRTLEAVAKASGEGERWFQLYWPKNVDVTLSLLRRARKEGYTTLVITLDTMQLGWRPHDLDASYLPFAHGYGTSIGISDPLFMAQQGTRPIITEPPFPYVPAEWHDKLQRGDQEALKIVNYSVKLLGEICSGTYKTWEDLKIIKNNWEGKIILKGVLRPDDAKRALEAGVHGVVVSNHGGRQVDGAIPALLALDRICADPTIAAAQAEGKFTVLFDSGIRTGSDILKALALGAQGVLIGRPFLYGLAIAGQEGVEMVLKCLLADLEITMGLCGYTSLVEVIGKRDDVMVKENI